MSKDTPPPFIIYKKQKYWIQSTGRYYQSGNHSQPERLLHRHVWAEANGKIEAGFQIHHINGDWTDNRLENLECIKAGVHQSQHMKERLSDPVNLAKAIEYMDNARVFASKWHGSADGRAWHSEHGKDTWVGRVKGTATCCVCGGEIQTHFPSRTRFCSKSCRAKTYYKDKRVIRTCANCGKDFDSYKYKEQECCSYTCAQALRKKKAAK